MSKENKNISCSTSFTDLYSSKYKYGTLFPKNACVGKKTLELLENGDWEKQNLVNNISEKNDNRMDRYYGFNAVFKHKESDVFIYVKCETSATGKTKTYTFSTSNVSSKEQFNQLLKIH